MRGRSDNRGKHFQADLLEPALLTVFEDGATVWATLALKGTDANRTPLGPHFIQVRVANETMTSEASFRRYRARVGLARL